MKIESFRILSLLAIAAWSTVLPVSPANAQVSIGVGIDIAIPLPPPIVFAAPPVVVLLPGSTVYVAPDVPDDVFFVDNWWWRPWQGHWYRSQSYDGGWVAYAEVPSFYAGVRGDWRQNYRDGKWDGKPWKYEKKPYGQIKAKKGGPPPHAGKPTHSKGNDGHHSKGGKPGKGKSNSGGGKGKH